MCSTLQVYPKTSGGYYASNSTIISRPLGRFKSVAPPETHYTRTEFKQFKNVNRFTGEDQVIQEEHFEAFCCKLMNTHSFHIL